MEYIQVIEIVIWPLVTLLFLLFITIFFRKQIRELLQRAIVRFKKGDAEFELSQQIDKEDADVQNSVVESPLSVNVSENNKRELIDTESEEKTTSELVTDMAIAFLDGDSDEGEGLYQKIQETENDPVEKAKSTALYWYWKYQRGDTSSLGELEDLSKKPDISDYVHGLIGLCY